MPVLPPPARARLPQSPQVGHLNDFAGALKPGPGVNVFEVAGEQYSWGGATSGGQLSPFNDATLGRGDYTVLNLRTRRSVSFGDLVPSMIANYGFYEGFGTRYRVSPERVIRTFTHLADR